MHQQPTNNMAAPHDDAELEKLLQSLTQIAGGKQDRKPNQDVGQEVIPKKGYVQKLLSVTYCECVRAESVLLLLHRFVVKTTDQHGQKVFINICSSEKVPMAGSWANGKVHCCIAACVKVLMLCLAAVCNKSCLFLHRSQRM